MAMAMVSRKGHEGVPKLKFGTPHRLMYRSMHFPNAEKIFGADSEVLRAMIHLFAKHKSQKLGKLR